MAVVAIFVVMCPDRIQWHDIVLHKQVRTVLDISIRHVGGTRENRFSESEFAVQIGHSRISQTIRIDH